MWTVCSCLWTGLDCIERVRCAVEYRIRLCDFGLSRHSSQSNMETLGKVTNSHSTHHTLFHIHALFICMYGLRTLFYYHRRPLALHTLTRTCCSHSCWVQLRGTMAYCAPEAYDGDTFTPAADIYSFGIVRGVAVWFVRMWLCVVAWVDVNGLCMDCGCVITRCSFRTLALTFHNRFCGKLRFV